MPVICTHKIPLPYYPGENVYVCMFMYAYYRDGNIFGCTCMYMRVYICCVLRVITYVYIRVYYMCRYIKNLRYPQWASSLLIMIVVDSPIGSIGSRNVHTPGYPLGPLVP